ncbi:hypothetical protein [uncultured Thiodictyon sp.]|uniref:hypothetical protein n=1 Tax=uncultured Thiodictyon sp. TaxID=1846217 RepID=UPI0025D9FABF|nr:hypothetical protein [uncultured Thiodictyon sp.]
MDRLSDDLAGRLARRLHSVFDVDPEAVLALRVQHAAGASWRVAGDVLTLTAAGVSTVVALPAYTMTTLATALTAAGYDVAYLNPALASTSATVLLAGAGTQGTSNGDHLLAFTAPLAALLTAIGLGMDGARVSVGAALAQMVLPQARQDWADLFGSLFGIRRLTGEEDGLYTARIIAETQRTRSSPAAILRNIHRLTGETLTLREPWKELFTLSEDAPLSGGYHLQGAPVWQFHTAQLTSAGGSPDWGAVMAVAQADRPAGTLFLGPNAQPAGILIDSTVSDQAALSACGDLLSAACAELVYGALSSDLSLSDYFIPPPWESVRFDVGWIVSTPLGAIRNPWLGHWDTRTWADSATGDFYPPVETTA